MNSHLTVNSRFLQIVSLQSLDKEQETVINVSVLGYDYKERGFVAAGTGARSPIIAHEHRKHPSAILHSGSAFDYLCCASKQFTVVALHRKKNDEDQSYRVFELPSSLTSDVPLRLVRTLRMRLGPQGQAGAVLNLPEADHNDFWEENLQVHFLDGPNICFASKSHFVYSCFYSEDLVVQDLAATLSIQDVKILCTGCHLQTMTDCIGVVLLSGKPTLASAIQEANSENIPDSILVAIEILPKTKPVFFGTICVSDFIPEAYASVVLCARITDLCHTVNSCRCPSASNSSQDQSMKYCNQTLVGTSCGQLIKFNSGVLQDGVQLPFCDPSSIHRVNSSVDDYHWAIQSKTGAVCVVSSAFQVLTSFEMMLPVLIGDFVGCGTEQLLLFPSSVQPLHDSTDWCQKFLLTDFSQHQINKLKGDVPVRVIDSGPANDSINSAAKALHSRLQNGATLLGETQRMVEIHTALLEQTTTAIELIDLGRDARTTARTRANVHLLPLLPGPVIPEEDVHMSTQPSSTSESMAAPEIACVWWKLFNSSLVVVAEVDNSTTRVLHSLQLVLTPVGNSDLHVEYKPVTLVPQCEAVPAPERKVAFVKRQRISMESSSRGKHVQSASPVSAFTYAYAGLELQLPEFGVKNKLQFSVAVLWLEQNPKAPSISIAWKAHCLDYGNVTVAVMDILSGKLIVQLESVDSLSASDVNRNLITLDLIQQEFALTLQSVHSGLKSVHLALESMGVHWCATYNCHVYTRPGPLQGVRVTVEYVGKTRLKMTAHARDRAQLQLFIHALYEYLPDDVTVASDDQNAKEQSIVGAIQDLHREISLSVDMLKRVKVEAKAQKVGSLGENSHSSEKSVADVRKDFTQRQACLKSWSSFDSLEHCINATKQEDLSKAILSTDWNMLKLASQFE